MPQNILSISLEVILAIVCFILSYKFYKLGHKIISISYFFIGITALVGALHYSNIYEPIKKIHYILSKIAVILATPAIGYGIILALKDPLKEQKNIMRVIFVVGPKLVSIPIIFLSEEIINKISLVPTIIFIFGLIKLILFYYNKSIKHLIFSLLTISIFIYIGVFIKLFNIEPIKEDDLVHFLLIFSYPFIYILVTDLKKYLNLDKV